MNFRGGTVQPKQKERREGARGEKATQRDRGAKGEQRDRGRGREWSVQVTVPKIPTVEARSGRVTSASPQGPEQWVEVGVRGTRDGGVVILNKVVRGGLTEKMITHEADIKAQRKGLLFIVASIGNRPFFIFTFTCVCSDWKNRTVTWATPLATHTPSLTSVSSVTCTLPDFLLCMCMYAGAGGQGRGDSLHVNYLLQLVGQLARTLDHLSTSAHHQPTSFFLNAAAYVLV